MTADYDERLIARFEKEYNEFHGELSIATGNATNGLNWRKMLDNLVSERDRLKKQSDAQHFDQIRLVTIIIQLRRIVLEHHSADVMIPDVCPTCTNEDYSALLDQAEDVIAKWKMK